MAFFWRWLTILLMFGLGGELTRAASLRQERAFLAAQSAFDSGMWSRAETEFAAFAARYPEAASTPMAHLMQAQAEIKQGDYTNAIRVLTLNGAKAGNLADAYLNWIGEAQYAAGDFPAAAGTFIALAESFTNSPLRMAATVNAAAAWGELGQWPKVQALLDAPDGVFAAGLHADADSSLSLRGQLLRAEACYAGSNYAGAVSILVAKQPETLPPELAWSWTYWLGQSKAAKGDLPDALVAATNLVQIARETRDDERLAESLNLRAAWLEKSQLTNEALADYEENLAGAKTPAEYQRQAILKIAELLTAQGQFTDAESRLNTFQQQSPGSAASAAALFTLGDLHLKDYAAQGAVTNLQLAQACLDQFLGIYTNSDFLGHAYLDRGWCGWLAGNYPAAAADFQTATTLLPRSFDQAVAHFKLGDALYQLNDFSNALLHYRSVVGNFMDVPAVVQQLDEPALYQSLRVSEAMGNTGAAQDALDRIVKMYPAGNLADNADLLFGENEAASGRPEAVAAARGLFQQFVKDFPHSELLPQASLAVARTYEQDTNWLAAITNYESWLSAFPASDLRPEAIYSAARDYYQAGDDTNALAQFTGFITGFPTNDLAPQAQWWVADYLFRTGNFAGAETNYENIFQNPVWKKSPLFYAAQFMAGRAAMGRNGYPDATRYFSTLISDTNCPMDLGVRARFACAAAWMQIPSADTNSPAANFATAITFLNQIVQLNPTNNDAARAWGEIGNCNFQMSDFDTAETSYEQVFGTNAPALAGADVSARGAAMVGYGLALEKQAEAADGADRTNLLQEALGMYLDVFDMNLGKNLRDGEQANPFWIKKAGLQALPLIESLGSGDPNKFMDQLEELLPNLKESLEKTRLTLQARP